MPEVIIRREDRDVVSNGDRADQKVRVRALHTLLPASVVEGCGLLVVIRRDLQVREDSQVLAQSIVLRPVTEAGQELLPDRTDHRDASILDQCPKLRDRRIMRSGFLTAQSEGPDR